MKNTKTIIASVTVLLIATIIGYVNHVEDQSIADDDYPDTQTEIAHHLTTAKLPDNKMIWPLPELSEFAYSIHVSGKFIEAKPLLTVSQGNWAEHTRLVRYKITKRHKNYPYDELTFIVIRRWPTDKSGIMMKALSEHFREGTKEFILKKDDQVRYMEYFSIMTYTKD